MLPGTEPHQRFSACPGKDPPARQPRCTVCRPPYSPPRHPTEQPPPLPHPPKPRQPPKPLTASPHPHRDARSASPTHRKARSASPPPPPPPTQNTNPTHHDQPHQPHQPTRPHHRTVGAYGGSAPVQNEDKRKEAPSRQRGGLEHTTSSGDRIRTCDLWVMSPASYRAAPPRAKHDHQLQPVPYFLVNRTLHPPETTPEPTPHKPPPPAKTHPPPPRRAKREPHPPQSAKRKPPPTAKREARAPRNTNPTHHTNHDQPHQPTRPHHRTVGAYGGSAPVQNEDKRKEAPSRQRGGLEHTTSSGDRIRTCDLWVMSPASYRAAPPRAKHDLQLQPVPYFLMKRTLLEGSGTAAGGVP